MSTPKTLVLWLYNDEEAGLALLARALSPEFTLQGGRDTASVTVPSRDSLALPVTFAPLSSGQKSAELIVAGDRRANVPCTGRAESDSCSVEPAELDFGPIPLGSSRTRQILIRNLGTVPLSGDVSASCSGFQVVEGGGPYTLEPSDSLQVQVVFSPESVEAYFCEVDLGATNCGTVSCMGEGGRVWYVKADGTGDAPTVQSAIDSSSGGGMVLVGPGTYYENINLRGKAIHLKSDLGPEQTVLDGSGLDSSVVVCNSDERNDTVIEGFTITGGRGTRRNVYSRIGGGILCLDSAPIIRRNVITGNTALNGVGGGSSRGGGLSVNNRDGSMYGAIEHNVIENNLCSVNGGGLSCNGNWIIEDNVICDNYTNAGDGAGIYSITPVNLTIRQNLIVRNHAGDHGGGIYISGDAYRPPSNIQVVKNLILHNTSNTRVAQDCSGAGVWISQGAVLTNNTIALNSAYNIGALPAAGGCCVRRTQLGTYLERNLFFRNDGGGIVVDETSVIHLSENLVYGHAEFDIYLSEGAEVQSSKNVFLDPLFCDTTETSRGHLAFESPALHQASFVIGAVEVGSCHRASSLAQAWEGVQKLYR